MALQIILADFTADFCPGRVVFELSSSHESPASGFWIWV